MLDRQLQQLMKREYGEYEETQQPNEKMKQSAKAVEQHLSGLTFAEKDEILSRMNAICAEYEYAAFVDGYLRGARLILSLLCSDV